MKPDQFVHAVIIVVFCLFILTCLTSLNAHAQEKYMATDVGHVVLTDEPCKIQWEAPGNGLDWHAYATDAQAKEPHIGCWRLVDPLTVQVFWPEIDYSGIYKTKLFLDEK